MPNGTVSFVADGRGDEGDFRKEALNVARLPDEPGNALHALFVAGSAHRPATPVRTTRSCSPSRAGRCRCARKRPRSPTTATPCSLFPTLAVACGVFAEPDRTVHEATTIHRLGAVARDVDRTREFAAFARGDSMDGGDDPIRHGDPLLFRWARGVDRRDLVGQRVLVDYRNGAARLRSSGLTETAVSTSCGPTTRRFPRSPASERCRSSLCWIVC